MRFAIRRPIRLPLRVGTLEGAQGPLPPAQGQQDPPPDTGGYSYDPAATFPHFNGDGQVDIEEWVPGTDYVIRGRVTPTVAGTRVVLGQIGGTTNYISFFAADQRLTAKIGGTAFSIVKDYLNTEVEFTLTMSNGTGTLVWGADSVAVTAGVDPVAFDVIGRNSLGFAHFDGWMQELDLTDSNSSANSRVYNFSVEGQVTDELNGTTATLGGGLDAADWSALP